MSGHCVHLEIRECNGVKIRFFFHFFKRNTAVFAAVCGIIARGLNAEIITHSCAAVQSFNLAVGNHGAILHGNRFTAEGNLCTKGHVEPFTVFHLGLDIRSDLPC